MAQLAALGISILCTAFCYALIKLIDGDIQKFRYAVGFLSGIVYGLVYRYYKDLKDNAK